MITFGDGIQERVSGPPGLGVRGVQGFTLIELLIVIVIIGILAAIAIPSFADSRDRALFSSIHQDMRHLGTAQEMYYVAHEEYATDLEDLTFTPSQGVDVQVEEASMRGWAAVATHDALDQNRGCAIYVGNAEVPTLPDGTSHEGGPGSVDCTE